MDMELSQDGGYELPPRKSMRSKPVGPLRAKWQKLSPKKKITLGLIAALSLVLVWGTALAINVVAVYSDLSQSKGLIKEIGSSLGEGNTDVSDPLISELETRLAQSNAVVSGPLWKSGEFIPFLGANLAAVRITTDSVNSVFEEAGLPALKLLKNPDFASTLIKDGGINLDSADQLVTLAQDARSSISASVKQLGSIDSSLLLPQVRDAVTSVSEPLTQANTVLTQLAPLLDSVPTMLGQDAPQHYLVMFQTNAEINPLGGHWPTRKAWKFTSPTTASSWKNCGSTSSRTDSLAPPS